MLSITTTCDKSESESEKAWKRFESDIFVTVFGDMGPSKNNKGSILAYHVSKNLID